MIEALIVLTVLLTIGMIFLFKILTNINNVQNEIKNKTSDVTVSVDTQPITAQLQHHAREVKDNINTLPEDILRAITGSANTHKGKLGELIGYINLKAEYDRVIPIGSIVDFICLTFPKDGKPGQIVFIDIKTGKNARLSTDQRFLKKIIDEKNIRFLKLDIDTIDVLTTSDISEEPQ